MVLGLRTKTRKNPLVQLDYIIHIQEIRPWPPSQSLRTLRAVVLQWAHTDKTCGFTTQVVPSLGTGSGVADGRIEFGESFRLPLTLTSIKSGDGDVFQRNCIEFNLYEPRRDKMVKGQLLGSAVLDLADYGIVKETLSVSVPINCKRTYRNTLQPLLFLKIRPNQTSSSSSHGESVSVLMSEEYAEEAEIATFTTDDDVSSHSSLAVTCLAADSNGSSSPENEEAAANCRAGEAKVSNIADKFVAKSDEKQAVESHVSSNSSGTLSCDIAWISSQGLQSCSLDEIEKRQNPNIKSNDKGFQGPVVNGERDVKAVLNSPIASEELDYLMDKCLDSDKTGVDVLLMAGRTNFSDDETREKHKTIAQERRIMEDEVNKVEDDPLGDFSGVDVQKEVTLEKGLLSKHGKSVRSSVDSSRSNGPTARSSTSRAFKDAKVYTKDTRNLLSDNKIQHLEHRIKVLEGELMEAAAIEVSLYSMVAEHGSSISKVHTPSRRLSRLYCHASKQNSRSARGTAAKSVVSGLVLVAKACGNDVPRLTFWLSNSIVLRVIVERSPGDSQLPVPGKIGDKNSKKPSSLKRPGQSTRYALEDTVGDWENPLTFAAALEKVEAWIFSRIIESLWWQTFTPHMQSGAAKEIRRSMDSESSKLYRRTWSSIDQQQGNFSLELWKKAFRDACERICPVRAGGHDCGCLPVLSKLIMEQLIARLDVAMFNAILRESPDEIPTDPIADPISDAEVLPIRAGNVSFSAGAQLKNTIGNWSRWLTDLFGIDDDDDLLETADDEDERRSHDTSSKSFHLLNAMSDLMMLPKDLLLSRTIRKEVCPALGPPLITRMINSFVPDEFCPDPIPGVVLEALNSEDPFDYEEDCIMNVPCAAAPIVYQIPSAASIAAILGEIGSHSKLRRSGSSLLKKSQTSDDELDEMDSPLQVVLDTFKSSPSSVKPSSTWNENGSRNTARYKLLQQAWMNCA